MSDVIARLKHEARKLHRRATAGDSAAIARIGKHLTPPARSDLEAACRIRRRHCLSAIGEDLGFDGWPHALQVLQGREGRDFGELLYTRSCGAYTNIWLANYEQAHRIHRQSGGFLLAYRRQCLIVEEGFIRTLGLDPEDPDWREIGWDWVRPDSRDARGRLYAKVVEARLK